MARAVRRSFEVGGCSIPSVVVARTFLASTLKRCRGGRDIVEARAFAATADVGVTEARGTVSTLQRRHRTRARHHQVLESSNLLRLSDPSHSTSE